MAATNISQFRARDMTAAWRHIDYLLILAMVVLSLFGLALVHSASRFFPEGSFMPRQGLFLIVGTGVTVLLAAVDFTWWTKYSPAFYAGGSQKGSAANPPKNIVTVWPNSPQR